MRRMKKLGALALAAIMAFSLLPFAGKEVKAADEGAAMRDSNSNTSVCDDIQNPLETLGAAYREETTEYGKGIRFGAKIDKTAIDYNKVTESGTLVAAKRGMENRKITELTLEAVESYSSICKKVVRTTYITETDKELTYAAAIVNIRDNWTSMEYVARPYVIIDGVTYYGEQVTASWTSVKAQVDAETQ